MKMTCSGYDEHGTKHDYSIEDCDLIGFEPEDITELWGQLMDAIGSERGWETDIHYSDEDWGEE